MNATFLAKTTLAALMIGIASASIVVAGEAGSAVDPYAARKVFYEEHWKNKIESALFYVRGAVVEVNVELTTEIERIEEIEKFDSEAATEFEHTKKTSSRNPGGRPNLVAQGPAKPAGASSSEALQDETCSKYAIPRTKTKTVIAGLVPQGVSVTVSIPSSYLTAIWKKRHADTSKKETVKPSPDELQAIELEVSHKIEHAVKMLLPSELGKNPLSGIEVTSFEDLGPNCESDTLTSKVKPQIRACELVNVKFSRRPTSGLKGKEQSSALPDGFPQLEMAAKVVAINPNGDIILEGRRTIENREEQQVIQLTGIVRSESLDQDRTVFISDIAELNIEIENLPNLSAFQNWEQRVTNGFAGLMAGDLKRVR